MTTSNSAIISYLSDGADFDDSSGPGRITVCKFVVINNAASSKLIFGPVSDFPYHAALVKRFCDERDIAAGWGKKPDLYMIYDLSYRVSGGGWMGYQPRQKFIRFFGQSTAYGRFEPNAVKQLFTSDLTYAGFTFAVDD